MDRDSACAGPQRPGAHGGAEAPPYTVRRRASRFAHRDVALRASHAPLSLCPGIDARGHGSFCRLYDRFDVREYWIVDPEHERVTVHRRAGDGRFPLTLDLASANDVLTTPLLPGFALRVSDLFG